MKDIATKEEAFDLANKINKHAANDDFKPFKFEADFEKKRSLPQNAYYHGVVVKSQYEYFKGNPIKFAQWLIKALEQNITTELIHEVNKIIYNGGKSTTKLPIGDFMENLCNPIRGDMFHLCGLNIPEPEDEEMKKDYEDYKQRTGEENVNSNS